MKQKIKFSGLLWRLFLAATFALSACNYKHLKNGGEEDVSDLSACGPVDYATVAVIFKERCVDCHNPTHAEKGVMLHDFANVKKELLRPNGVKDQIESNKMPLGRPLPAAEKSLILAWISQDAPETQPSGVVVVTSCKEEVATTPPPPVVEPVVEPLVPSYNSLFVNIFDKNKKCTGCHNPSAVGGRAKYDFSTYQAMIANKSLFNVADPENSTMLEALNFGMMPPGGPFLSSAEIAVIGEWIKRGLPETLDGPPGIPLVEETPVEPPPVVTVPQTPPVVDTPIPQLPGQNGEVVVSPPACEEPEDFAKMDRNIFKPLCSGCHGVRVMPAFDSYGAVFANLQKIASVIRLDQMPPRRPPAKSGLEKKDKDALLNWIAKGAPEKVSANDCNTNQ